MEMYDLVEVEDFGLNHYLHHFGEEEVDAVAYNEEYGSIDAATECVEDINWN